MKYCHDRYFFHIVCTFVRILRDKNNYIMEIPNTSTLSI